MRLVIKIFMDSWMGNTLAVAFEPCSTPCNTPIPCKDADCQSLEPCYDCQHGMDRQCSPRSEAVFQFGGTSLGRDDPSAVILARAAGRTTDKATYTPVGRLQHGGTRAGEQPGARAFSRDQQGTAIEHSCIPPHASESSANGSKAAESIERQSRSDTEIAMDSSEQRYVQALHNWWRPVEIKPIERCKRIQPPRDSEHHLFKLRNRLDGHHRSLGHESHDGDSTHDRLFMKGLAHGRVVKPHHLQHGHHHQHVEGQHMHCAENAHDAKRKAVVRDIEEIVNEQREKHRIRMLEKFWDEESGRVHYHNGMFFTMPSVTSDQKQEGHAHQEHGHCDEWHSSVKNDAAAAPTEPVEMSTGFGRYHHHTKDSKRKGQGSATSLWLERMMRRWVE